jgi:hypothetical protein
MLLSVTVDIGPDSLPFVTAATTESLLMFGCRDVACAAVEESLVPVPGMSPGTQAVGIGVGGSAVVRVGPLPDAGERGDWTRVLACEDAACTSFAETRIDGVTPAYSRGGLIVDADGATYVLAHAQDGARLYRCSSPECAEGPTQLLAMPGAWSVVITDGLPLIVSPPGLGPLRIVRCEDAECTSMIESVIGGEIWITSMSPLASTPDGRVSLLAMTPHKDLALVVWDAQDRAVSASVVLASPTPGEEIQAASITVDHAGNPVAAWVSVPAPGWTESNQSRLWIAHCDDPGCASGTISLVPTDDVGCGFIDVDVDETGRTALVYHLWSRETGGSLVVVSRCPDPGCVDVSTDVRRW